MKPGNPHILTINGGSSNIQCRVLGLGLAGEKRNSDHATK